MKQSKSFLGVRGPWEGHRNAMGGRRWGWGRRAGGGIDGEVDGGGSRSNDEHYRSREPRGREVPA